MENKMQKVNLEYRLINKIKIKYKRMKAILNNIIKEVKNERSRF